MKTKPLPHVRINPKLHTILKQKAQEQRRDLEALVEECLRIGMTMKKWLPRVVKA